MSCGPHGFREDFLRFSYYKSMGANDPRGMANLDPRGFIGRIYVGDHQTLLSCGPHNFRKKDSFNFFFNCKSMGANDPQRSGQFGPEGHAWNK